jgi:hypothetical protein
LLAAICSALDLPVSTLLRSVSEEISALEAADLSAGAQGAAVAQAA